MTSPFVFTDEVENLGTHGARVVVLDCGLSTRDELFDALADALSFPDWFGRNWDALEDCLCDLDWIEERRVVVFHAALPDLPEDELVTWLEILRDSALDWRPDEAHELVIAFPTSAVPRIAELITAPEGSE